MEKVAIILLPPSIYTTEPRLMRPTIIASFFHIIGSGNRNLATILDEQTQQSSSGPWNRRSGTREGLLSGCGPLELSKMVPGVITGFATTRRSVDAGLESVHDSLWFGSPDRQGLA